MRCRALPCPHCGSSKVQEQRKKTSLGSCTFRCAACTRRFNERSIPTNIVYLVVPWRLRYPPSLYLLAGMFLKRSVAFSHETVLALEALVAPLLTEQLRTWRKGKASPKWHADETYIEVHDVWCYLNWAIDVDGNLVGSMLSDHQDLDTARRFFARSLEMVGHGREQVTTDRHASCPTPIRETAGRQVEHRCNQYLNNRLEQDHLGIKQRYRSMRRFGSFHAESRVCLAFEELRNQIRCGGRWVR